MAGWHNSGDKVEFRKAGRIRRGSVEDMSLDIYKKMSLSSLISLINDADPQNRTAAALILGNLCAEEAVHGLCDAIKNEKHLYCRLAQSEALKKIGEAAIPDLISLLGKIGHNQEKELPFKCFGKKSYPLIRDLAARTLAGIGKKNHKPVIQALKEIVRNGNPGQIPHAIDAIGFIASQTGDCSGFPALAFAISRFSCDQFMVWRIIRAVSGFHIPEAADCIIDIIEKKMDLPDAVKWEAARSLGIIALECRNRREDVLIMLEKFLCDPCPRVKISAEKALAGLRNHS